MRGTLRSSHSILTWINASLGATSGFLLLMLPARWDLRERSPMTRQGVETLDAAAAACRRTGLDGWDLVTFAQRLVYARFACYSCRNLWDTPAQTFRYGMGYGTRYRMFQERH